MGIALVSALVIPLDSITGYPWLSDNTGMNDSNSHSSQRLMRLQTMQSPAWTRLVESFSPIVYSWYRQAGLAGHDAADVVQDVFSIIARRIHQFDQDRPNAVKENS